MRFVSNQICMTVSVSKESMGRQNSSVKIQTDMTVLRGNGTKSKTKSDKKHYNFCLSHQRHALRFCRNYFSHYNDTEAIADRGHI